MSLKTNTKKNQVVATREPFSSVLQKKRKTYGYLIAAGIIPALIFLLIYIARAKGVFPFTTLSLDLNGQYVYYFESLRESVLGDGSMLYSFARQLGGEFLGIYAYYLASPLSYLVCLFPADKIQEFVLFLLLLKSSICGITMGYYLHKHSEKLNKLSIIAFSVMYAVCAYCVVYQSNTMWIDSVMWLPLLTLGIEELVKHGKFKLFTVMLALTVASNFYTGYMCCIFVVLYFFYYMYSYKDDFANNPLREKQHFLKSLIRIALFSILAIAIAAAMLIGAVYSLGFGKNTFTNPDYDIAFRIDFFDIFFKFLPGSYDTVRPGGYPFVYCGMLTLLLAPLYFFSKKFTTRQKVGAGVLIGIFMLSFVLSTADLIWHGFQKPQWLNNRYSFMLCFFMIFLAFKAFETINEKRLRRTLAAVAATIVGFVVILQKMAPTIETEIQGSGSNYNQDYTFGHFQTVLFAIILVAVYVCILAFVRKGKNKELLSAVILVVVCIEVFTNGLVNTVDYAEDVGFTSYDKYNQFQSLMEPITDTVLDYDESFYRFEKTIHRKRNDNMSLFIRGLSNSTSTFNASTIDLLRMMGYASPDNAHWSKYLGGNPVSDSLLGLKYIITDRDYSSIYGDPVLDVEDFAEHEGMTVDELIDATLADNSGSESYSNKSAEDFVVYKNPFALSLAFAAGDDVIDFNMKMYNTFVKAEEDARYNDSGYSNVFERLNALYSAIAGYEVEVFKPIMAKNENGTCDSSITHKISSKHNRYTKNNSTSTGKITFEYTDVPEGAMLYLYMPSFYTSGSVSISASSSILDKSTSVQASETNRIIELGVAKSSTYNLTVTMAKTTTTFYTIPQDSYIYYVDMDVLKDVTDDIADNQLVIEKYTERKFIGTIKTEKADQTILTTIPYDEGWQVYVDGKKVDVIDALQTEPNNEVGGALLAFKIDNAGEHEIKMVYRPTVIVLGFTVSFIAIAAFVALVIFEERIRKNKVYRYLCCVEDGQDADTKNDSTNQQSHKS